MNTPKITTSEINLLVVDHYETYVRNNEYVERSTEQIANIYDLEKLQWANHLDGLNIGELHSFNTYNWGAPIVFDGVYGSDMELALVNIHIGGDVRGNYSDVYYTDNYDVVHSILSQQTELYLELSDGREFTLFCDNGEAYFDLNSIDPYWIDFDSNLSEEQLTEIEENMEEL